MKWSRRLLLLIFLAVGLAVLVWALLQPGNHEPTYEGKKLSHWLTAAIDHRFSDRQGAIQATNAVHHIGTNALPFLLQWMEGEIPKWRENLVERLPRKMFWHPRIARPLLGRAGTRLWLALTGFEILGEEAAPAVPTLIAFAGTQEAETKSQVALLALSYLGNAGVTALICIATNNSIPAGQRNAAARCLSLPYVAAGTNLTWAVPALARCSSDSATTKAATEALDALAKQSPSVISNLLEACSSADPILREGATNALRVIAPQLIEGLH